MIRRLLFALLLTIGAASGSMSAHAWLIQAPVSFTPYDPGNARVMYGLRAMTAAAAAAHANAIRIRRASDSAETNITVLSNGALDVATASTFCASTNCYATTIYDQSGHTDCNLSAAACNLTAPSTGQQPELIFNCLGAHPCLRFLDASSSCMNSTTNARAQAQPLTYSVVTKKTYDGVSNQRIFLQDVPTTNPNVSQRIGINSLSMGAGNTVAATVTDAIWIAWQAVFNGASSVMLINGTETSGNAGTGAITAVGNWALNGTQSCGLGSANPNQDWLEASYFPSLQDSTARADMEAYQRGYWGF